MSQARSSSSLYLQLTPMQIPETAISAGIGGAELLRRVGAASLQENRKASLLPEHTPASNSLVLYPGEPSEMVVKIKNLGTRLLELHLESQGNFPAFWCRTHMEGQIIAPGQEIYALLYFRVPENFFESDRSLAADESLVLDYRSRIDVSYTEINSGQQGLETASFSLHVRPRSLYLDFLPSIYREADFIGRFLHIFEQAFEPTVEILDSLSAYLDPLTAPVALLPFLAYWVGWPIDSRWSVMRQRYLIGQALELYRWRGTRRGLRLYLHLYTDLPLDEHLPEDQKHISIEEIFSEGFVLGGTRLGEDSLLGGGRPYHFIVHLRLDPGKQVDPNLVREVIEREKPAFCTYDLFIEQSNQQLRTD
ncbi:phage tail protein [uncultured Nostoc sp.]|uniref:phage tail protein n=1 Tax=uncultured Nostoc sp. TaxID=340711 RepID=UPI0035CA129A